MFSPYKTHHFPHFYRACSKALPITGAWLFGAFSSIHMGVSIDGESPKMVCLQSLYPHDLGNLQKCQFMTLPKMNV
jgi:hypothetical protein